MLKFGGGRALTKHTSDECALKCHLSVEETKRLVENNVVVCDVQVSPDLGGKLDVSATESAFRRSECKLGRIMPELYDLEDCVESKPVKIRLDLDLYQMEQI